MLTFIRQLVEFLAPAAVLLGKAVHGIVLAAGFVASAFGVVGDLLGMLPAEAGIIATVSITLAAVSLVLRIVRGGGGND